MILNGEIMSTKKDNCLKMSNFVDEIIWKNYIFHCNIIIHQFKTILK